VAFKPLPAQGAQRVVAHHGDQPGHGAGARGIEAARLHPGGDVRVLQHFFRLRRGTRHAQRDVVQIKVGEPVKLMEGVLAAFAHGAQQGRQVDAALSRDGHGRHRAARGPHDPIEPSYGQLSMAIMP
jgi:hypothetical protein